MTEQDHQTPVPLLSPSTYRDKPLLSNNSLGVNIVHIILTAFFVLPAQMTHVTLSNSQIIEQK